MPVTYIPIATTVASGAVSNITFSSLSGYTDLLFKISWRSSDVGVYTGLLTCRPNNISTTSYYNRVQMWGDGGSVLRTLSTSSTAVGNTFANAEGNLANTFTYAQFYIPSYTRASSAHNLGFMSFAQNGTNNANAYSNMTSTIMNSTAAITSVVFIDVGGNIAAGTRIDVYGISAT